MPNFPMRGNRSEQENIIWDNKFDPKIMLEDEKILKNIWDNKTFDFVNDFETVEDLKEVVTIPESYKDVDEITRFKDYSSNAVNTRNGNRVTTNQPEKHKRAIFFVGCSSTFGYGADDSHTFESYLQRKLNKYIPNEGFIVYNYGYYLNGMRFIDNLLPIFKTLPAKKGDIVFLWWNPSMLSGLPSCDLSLKSKRPHEYGEIFCDMSHYTANGNRMIADGLFDFLKEHDFFRNVTMTITNQCKDSSVAEEKKLLIEYKHELAEFYKKNIQPKVGAIVMNANPFTYGHRYLVEEALKECDDLIVFVVEEDKSIIPFKDRFALVKENLADLNNVFVRRSGEFIISATTFSEYFAKESLQDKKIDTTLDVTLFAKEIAPSLNISVRFAGNEPMDAITRQYNEDMEKILPQYGISFKEIKRAKNKKGEIISASTVRKLANAGEFDKLKDFAPPATVEYLRKKYK